MKKLEFISLLEKKLSCLPRADREERLSFYSEMIDDLIEDGLSEQEAVKKIGSIDEIVSQVIAETPLTTLVKAKMRPKKRMKTWEIILLAAGSPIWLSLLISALAVAVSLYAVLWSVVVSFWALFASVTLCAPAAVLSGAALIYTGYSLSGAATIAAGLICAGLAIFLFFGCKFVTKGTAWLTKATVLLIKRCFMKKEDVQ